MGIELGMMAAAAALALGFVIFGGQTRTNVRFPAVRATRAD